MNILIWLRECFRRLSIVGAALLLYAVPSFARHSKPATAELNSIPKRVAAVQKAMKTKSSDAVEGKLLAQWGNWGNWNNWGNWSNWNNWANWGNWRNI
jgi:hypothetical protein